MAGLFALDEYGQARFILSIMSKHPFFLPPYQVPSSGVLKTMHNVQSIYMRVGDQMGNLLNSFPPEELDALQIIPAFSSALYALVTIFQYAEGLTDQQAAAALCSRLDWKYALRLPVDYAGFEPLHLRDFRAALRQKKLAQDGLDRLIAPLVGWGLLPRKERQTPAIEVVRSVCMLNRIAFIVTALNQALEAAAAAQPEWVRSIILPHWYERYGQSPKIPGQAAGMTAQDTFAQSVGLDGAYLLRAISEVHCPELANLPDVLALRQVWNEQYDLVEGVLLWRKDTCAHCVLPVGKRFSIEEVKLNR